MNEIHKFLLDVIDAGHEIHDEPKRFAHYLDHLGYGDSVRTYDIAQLTALAETEAEHFLGQYKSPADFAEESLGNAYAYELEALPSIIRNGIDWAEIWDSEYRHDCFDEEIYDDGEFWTLIWHAH